jgi:16S rRNA (guanine1207-N2)-methyltransferase
MNIPVPDPAPRALRIELALASGLTLPAEGPIAVLHPHVGETLTPLPQERVTVITPHAPDHTAFAAQGYAMATDLQRRFAAAVVCLPRARPEARDLIARAVAATDGPVVIDGQKHDGIDAMLRELRKRTDLSEAIAKGHGKIAWMAGGADLSDWIAEPGTVTDAAGHDWQTAPGTFSADGVDPASAMLADALPSGLKGTVADLGAGWGYLSARLLAKAPGIATLHLIESDSRALACARVNITDARAQFHWADATHPLPRLQADTIIMNPPFHTGREARPQLGAAFIRTAAMMLKPSGQLWLVANRHLPYETALTESFRKLTETGGTPGFKILHAEGPQRSVPSHSPRIDQRRGRRA